jgi:hypothetical protein
LGHKESWTPFLATSRKPYLGRREKKASSDTWGVRKAVTEAEGQGVSHVNMEARGEKDLKGGGGGGGEMKDGNKEEEEERRGEGEEEEEARRRRRGRKRKEEKRKRKKKRNYPGRIMGIPRPPKNPSFMLYCFYTIKAS